MDKGGNKATALFFLKEAATVSECGKVPQEEPENLKKSKSRNRGSKSNRSV